MARILIVTDAWHPQVNGVVRTLDTTTRTLRAMGHTVEVLEPSAYKQVAAPFYPEIRFALAMPGRVAERMRKFAPDHIHISTEGPLGLLAIAQDRTVDEVEPDGDTGIVQLLQAIDSHLFWTVTAVSESSCGTPA